MQAVATGQYRPPLDQRLPVALRQLIERCWHHDPHQRPEMGQVK